MNGNETTYQNVWDALTVALRAKFIAMHILKRTKISNQ